MKMRTIYLIPLATLIFALCGCAPGFGARVTLPELAAPPSRTPGRFIQFQMRPVVDDRANPPIIIVDGRGVLSSSDIGSVVDNAFRSYAHNYGWQLRAGEGKIISVRVLDWVGEVRPSFPASTVDARVELEIEIWNASLNLDFRSRYAGSTTFQHPWLNQERVLWAVNDALGFALKEFFTDDRVQRHL
jgi:hypothetical protein